MPRPCGHAGRRSHVANRFFGAAAQCGLQGIVRRANPMTVWPSGPRRWLQAPVRTGVGSNPTAVTRSLDAEGPAAARNGRRSATECWGGRGTRGHRTNISAGDSSAALGCPWYGLCPPWSPESRRGSNVKVGTIPHTAPRGKTAARLSCRCESGHPESGRGPSDYRKALQSDALLARIARQSSIRDSSAETALACV